MLHYPKSFLRLILLGFALVALPLAVAIGYAVFAMQNLTQENAIAMQRVTATLRASHELSESLTLMERLLRQYQVLQEAMLLEDYQRAHTDFSRITREMKALPLVTEGRTRLDSLMTREQNLHALINGGDAASIKAFTQQLKAIDDDARGVLSASRAVADAEAARQRDEAESARHTLWLLLLATVPLALATAWWFRRIIAQQIGQFDAAIRAIGGGEYARPIVLNGPADLAALGQRLDWLRQRLSNLESERRRFLQHLSHDLKTPLTALREGAQLLGEGVPGALSEQQKMIVAIMTQNSLRLQHMIENLLNLQAVDLAAATLDVQPVALGTLCEQVLHTHKLAAASRGIRFAGKLEPLQIEGDASMLRVVIDNLVTNAIKYSPPEATVELSLCGVGKWVVFDVIDEGGGVAEAEREKIFEPFFRGKLPQSEGIEGSGLGLAITREYVLAHRGTIELVTGEYPGGHFRVSLPQLWNQEQ